MYTLKFTKNADKAIARYKRSNPANYKKLVLLLDELAEHPRTGSGHPEPLKYGYSFTYSRRISKTDRLVSDIFDDEVMVLILTVEGHYDDK